LAAVFLIGIGPKSLEVQNEAVHPIGFIRRMNNPITDENLKSIPLIGLPFRSLKGDFSRAFAKVSGRIKTG
jgi:hypothetical protein